MQDFMATQNFYDPKVSILVGIVFLLREIELANATRSRVTVEEHDSRITLLLPVSQTDITGVGLKRSWFCTCKSPQLGHDSGCVYDMMLAHLDKVDKSETVMFVDVREAGAGPLFPNGARGTVAKSEVVGAVERQAHNLGQHLFSTKGDRPNAGHTLRVSCAQWLAEMGNEEAKIHTFAIWSSDIVMHYLGEAHRINLSAEVMEKRQGVYGAAQTSTVMYAPAVCDEAKDHMIDEPPITVSRA